MPRGLPYALAKVSAASANTVAGQIEAATATSLVQSATALDDATLSLDVAEAVASSATPAALSLATYKSNITTGGTDGTEPVTIGDGTGAVIGQRKLVTLTTLTSGSDVVSLDHANCVAADGTTAVTNLDLDAAGEFVLLEWNGTKWQIVYSDATVAT